MSYQVSVYLAVFIVNYHPACPEKRGLILPLVHRSKDKEVTSEWGSSNGTNRNLRLRLRGQFVIFCLVTFPLKCVSVLPRVRAPCFTA